MCVCVCMWISKTHFPRLEGRADHVLKFLCKPVLSSLGGYLKD